MPQRPSLIVLIVILWLLSGIRVIRPGERAIVQRFGAIVAYPAAGLWVGWPWGIDRLHRLSVQSVRQLTVGFDPARDDPSLGQFLTADHNLVHVQLAVHYSIGESAAELQAYFLQQERVGALMERETEAATAEWIAAHAVDEVLLRGSAAIPLWVQHRLQQRLNQHHSGIRIQQIHVVWLTPPEEVRSAFTAVNQAQTAMGMQLQQARQHAEQRRRQAEALAYRYSQEAETTRLTEVRQAEADVAEFHTLRNAMAATPEQWTLFWWQQMHQSLAALKNRGGRIEPIDTAVGSQGLDLTHLLRLRDAASDR
jgi:membrane protease subunit HflK